MADVEFEVDDEDCNRIYFDTPKYDYAFWKRGIKLALIELFEEENITNYKINTRLGEIKFYETTE